MDDMSVKQEWRVLKTTISNDGNLKSLTASKVMEQLAGNLREGFPCLSKIAAVGLLIPTSTAGN